MSCRALGRFGDGVVWEVVRSREYCGKMKGSDQKK